MREQQVLDDLTTREKQVISLVVDGNTNDEVAEMLFIERPTVETHLRNVRSKLGAKNTLQAAVIAVRNDLI